MKIMTINAEMLASMFLQGTYELYHHKEIVDALNVFPVPDGDTGTNMSLTMNSAVEGLKKGSFQSVDEVAKLVSRGSLMGARGNSGVILSQIFRGFSKGCKDLETLDSIQFCNALKHAADTAYSAVLKPVEGTILTIIRKIAEKAMEYAVEEVPIDELIQVLIKRGEETLEETPEYLEVLKQAGVVDAGGKGLIYIFKGFDNALQGKGYKEVPEKETAHAAAKPAQAVMQTEDIQFAYCTEFIIEGNAIDGTALKQYIETLGDSMVFVQDEELVKVHVHTNNPGLALEAALKQGELKKVKIENMKDQHHSIIDEPSAEYTENTASIAEERPHDEKYGFIAVSMGDGFSNIFEDLGIHGIITGGQTMNPSTEDFLNEIEKCPSEAIFLFPNNSNIIMAANQAKAISKKNVFVIPTKTMPQCITAMLAFDHDVEAENNMTQMTESLEFVKTIQVTYAVRDTSIGGMAIEKDDYLAVADGTIKSVGKDRDDVLMEAIEKTMDSTTEILSIYYGSDISEAMAKEVGEMIEAKFPQLEIEVYEGAQPIYYFVLALE
ncbi:MAG: fatty acid kinase [Clostridiales bacterium]|nr:fatty acid kinase [Clostridiales bacterium]MDN5299515.1 fatty acid kinase [Clostridiales bacterium]